MIRNCEYSFSLTLSSLTNKTLLLAIITLWTRLSWPCEGPFKCDTVKNWEIGLLFFLYIFLCLDDIFFYFLTKQDVQEDCLLTSVYPINVLVTKYFLNTNNIEHGKLQALISVRYLQSHNKWQVVWFYFWRLSWKRRDEALIHFSSIPDYDVTVLTMCLSRDYPVLYPALLKMTVLLCWCFV